MKIPVNFGGGGSGSDDVTATAAQVLSPYTAITSESDDEPQIGTMADYAGTTQSASGSLDTSNSRYQLTIPNNGRYTTGSKIYQTYANARSTIGLTDASKILSGTTILGLSGSMADYSGTSTAATSSTSGSNVRLKIPNNGYYNTSAYLTNSYSNMASTIGLTAAKLSSQYTVLGITGTSHAYTYIDTSTSISTSSASTESWVETQSGSTRSMRSFSLSNIGFTPVGAWFLCDESCTMCRIGSCHVLTGSSVSSTYSNRTGYYAASDNSSFSFSSSSIHVPLYFTSTSSTCWYVVVGYK